MDDILNKFKAEIEKMITERLQANFPTEKPYTEEDILLMMSFITKFRDMHRNSWHIYSFDAPYLKEEDFLKVFDRVVDSKYHYYMDLLVETAKKNELKKKLKYSDGSPGETASKIAEQYLYHIRLGKTKEVACSLVLNNYIRTFQMLSIEIDVNLQEFLRTNHQNNPALITYFLTMISAEHAGLIMQYKMHLDLILEVITEVHNEMLKENQTASELRSSIEKAMGRNG